MKPVARYSRSGAALVIVLGLLTILFALIVTFLSRMTVERSSSASFAASASTRQFADTAVQLVQASIRDAATQGTQVAWTSQPGMIRTFDNSGNLVKAYKLYSSSELITTAAAFTNSIDADIPPASWATDAASWTDLNAPVVVGTTTNYPILDPMAENSVQGFTLDPPAGATSVAGQMPVRWLYILQNGQLVAPTAAGNGSTATVVGASATNPIVGRVAFWTDDESTKVNINTSSEGTYWDTPRADTTQDRALANNQPVKNEFQRYPGHPAMTSLAPVFFATNSTSTPDLTEPEREAIYQITPRIVGGGSKAGTVPTSSTLASGELNPDEDRLYSSVDELIFAANRSSQPTDVNISRADIETRRFFLTANSRAPETTLFNTPRIAVWPLDTLPANRTPVDNLMAFCSTINGQLYSFQRSDPQSATADYTGIARNQELYTYLQNLTNRNIPGFGGGSFLAKYPVSGAASERDQILTEIFDYIRTTNTDDNFQTDAAKRFSTRGVMAARATRTQAGLGQVSPIRIGNTQGFGRFPLLSEIGIQFIATASSTNATSNNATLNKSLAGTALTANQTRVEARLLYEAFVPGQGFPRYRQAFTVRLLNVSGFSVNGTPLNFPSDDFDWWDYYVGGNLWGGKPWGGVLSVRSALARAIFPARGPYAADTSPVPTDDPYLRYPFLSVPITVNSSTGTMTFDGGSLTVELYSGFLSGFSGAVPVQTQTVTFPAATLPVPTLAGAVAGNYPTGTAETWWTFQRSGWKGTSSPAGRPNRQDGTQAQCDPGSSWTALGPAAPFLAVIDGTTGATSQGDVVRSMVPAHSDFRLLLRPGGVNFQKHPAYDSTSAMAHSFVEASKSLFAGGVTLRNGTAFAPDRLATGVDHNLDSPDVTIYNNRAAEGDWDSGVGRAPDGPYINKADEGNLGNTSGTDKDAYFSDVSSSTIDLAAAFFSANRQIPSAAMFGSLPTGLLQGNPYRTLLFRPQSGHFGWTSTPRDHLLLDLFWMPVAEPYAISEPFSTAGKINMNYEIMPFRSMIQRSTAMVAALRSERLSVIPTTLSLTYKAGPTQNTNTRLPLNIPNTLLQFEDKFARNDVFRSPSQICEIHMVPQGESVSAIPGSGGFQTTYDSWASNYWNTNRLTGDNVRERVYANLLGRMTTKSNTFTVHVRAQTLKKSIATTANVWDETRDKVTGEYRGSTLIERYINPNDTTIPDFATTWPTSTTDLGPSYKWRTVNSRQFAP
ncbi:MAG: Verru_Chthon cassette protein A [Candidatus Methylacidiphilales bacterium]|nr:Verru_Chthon cassette protein A [Candidatus Methylacidiphilales bacterium]